MAPYALQAGQLNPPSAIESPQDSAKNAQRGDEKNQDPVPKPSLCPRSSGCGALVTHRTALGCRMRRDQCHKGGAAARELWHVQYVNGIRHIFPVRKIA
jgi:hypothetical protein